MQQEGKKPRKKSENTEKTGVAADLFYWAEALVFALTILVVMSVFFVRLSAVDGSSMLPTLHHNDRLLVSVWNKNSLGHGDIVVVTAPMYEEEPLVKRIIAMGGDTIDIDNMTGQVYLNGELLYEPYINETIRNSGSHSYPFTVPDGHIFVMGDNRNHSADSRVAEIGAIPLENVIGKVAFRIFPFGDIGKVK